MRRFGPGLVVTAAFIGPGTVTTASVSGASFGFALLWAVLFSLLATMVLQEMAARLGLVTGHGLSEALRSTFRQPLVRGLVAVLVISAITFGNAAFETGNITGAALGLAALNGGTVALWSILVGVAAFALLATGRYRVVERALIVLVATMGLVFLTTAIMVRPDPAALWQGLVPQLPQGSALTVIALIGTTVVPYNLFLHSSSVNEKWHGVDTATALRESRADTVLSIGLGGLITMAILATAAAAFFGSGIAVNNAGTMATQLEPLLGAGARYFFAAGLMAAGITSAVTAPLAAAYATAGALGLPRDYHDRRFQAVWAAIIVIGTVLAAVGTKPVAAILFAQAANGLLLPLIAGFLLLVMNRSELLGQWRNRMASNLLGGAVILVVSALGIFQLLRVGGIIG